MTTVIFSFHLFANFIYQAASDVYIDGAKTLRRDARDGVAYAKFSSHKFRFLNLTAIVSASVKEPGECGKLCVEHSSCFSTNLAAFRNRDGYMLCELLASDKYNNSAKFVENAVFHHLSIKVREIVKYIKCRPLCYMYIRITA